MALEIAQDLIQANLPPNGWQIIVDESLKRAHSLTTPSTTDKQKQNLIKQQQLSIYAHYMKDVYAPENFTEAEEILKNIVVTPYEAQETKRVLTFLFMMSTFKRHLDAVGINYVTMNSMSDLTLQQAKDNLVCDVKTDAVKATLIYLANLTHNINQEGENLDEWKTVTDQTMTDLLINWITIKYDAIYDRSLFREEGFGSYACTSITGCNVPFIMARLSAHMISSLVASKPDPITLWFREILSDMWRLGGPNATRWYILVAIVFAASRG